MKRQWLACWKFATWDFICVTRELSVTLRHVSGGVSYSLLIAVPQQAIQTIHVKNIWHTKLEQHKLRINYIYNIQSYKKQPFKNMH